MRTTSRSSSSDQFLGPVIDVRFVSLLDGRKVMQIRRQGEYWQTPPTVMASDLTEDEKVEIMDALGYPREEHENNDGV